MKISEVREEWKLALYGELADSTIKSYSHTLQHLKRYFDNCEIQDITVRDLRMLRKKLLDSKLKKSTVKNIMLVIRLFFQFAYEEGFVNSPMQRLKIIKIIERYNPKTIPVHDINKMIDNARTIRDEIIIRILADSGMRLSALCNIRACDCDFKKGVAIVLTKGQYKTVYFSKLICRLLSIYIASNEPDPSQKIFKITRQGIHKMLKTVGRRAGVKVCNAHSFRHSLAKRLLEGGANMAFVAEVLGHSNIQTTYKYYARYSPDSIQAEKERYLSSQDCHICHQPII
jgi:integrase